MKAKLINEFTSEEKYNSWLLKLYKDLKQNQYNLKKTGLYTGLIKNGIENLLSVIDDFNDLKENLNEDAGYIRFTKDVVLTDRDGNEKTFKVGEGGTHKTYGYNTDVLISRGREFLLNPGGKDILDNDDYEVII